MILMTLSMSAVFQRNTHKRWTSAKPSSPIHGNLAFYFVKPEALDMLAWWKGINWYLSIILIYLQFCKLEGNGCQPRVGLRPFSLGKNIFLHFSLLPKKHILRTKSQIGIRFDSKRWKENNYHKFVTV